jgi:hypothetical protein
VKLLTDIKPAHTMCRMNDLTDEQFGHWMAGFTDGEGCFYCRVSRPRRGSISEDIEPAFSIILRDDDLAILEEIILRTGWKTRIQRHGAMTNRQGIRSNPRAKLEVRRALHCMEVVRFFDKFRLRAKKRNDFAIWREIVIGIAQGPRGSRWGGPADRSDIISKIEQLKAGRAYK